MIQQTYVVFPSPVTLRLSLPASPRQRLITTARTPVERSFERLPLTVRIDAAALQITAFLSPIAAGLPLYAAADFTAAAPDTMDDHAERVLQLIGSDPATHLQALIDGLPLPEPPPRVPREIPNWRAKAILATMGKLDAVDALIAAMPEPEATVMRLAWHGNAALARRSQTVRNLGQALGLTPADLDVFFISADAINL